MRASNLTAITNSLDVVQALAFRNDVRMVVIGGELSITSGTNVGPLAESQIEYFRAHRAVMGARAVSPREGLTSTNVLTAQTKRAMARCARELIVVADSTKLGKFAPYEVAPCEMISTLVTDCYADPGILEEFREMGVEVVVASGDDLQSAV
jgi:DeoR/GlpR family transcriptional regulator of sugar metabolism